MEKWRGKVAIVTGASSGIGAAVAKELVKMGMVVVGAARREDRVKDLTQELKNEVGKLIALKTDLRKEEEIKELFRFAEKDFGGADVLVNNSGVSETEQFTGHQVDSGRAAVYTASKHAVTALSKCMRRELTEQSVWQNSNIKITSISPGLTRTEIVKGTIAELMFDQVPVLDATDVAEAVVNSLSTSDVTQICEVVLTPFPNSLGVY